MFMMGIIGAVLLLHGCASMVNGNSTDVLITTNKPARIIIRDYLDKPYHEGETPLKITLPHRSINSQSSEFWLYFSEKNNPQNKKKFFIKARNSGWFWGNFLFIHPFAVIWGFCIDFDSDARYCFEDKYHFDI